MEMLGRDSERRRSRAGRVRRPGDSHEKAVVTLYNGSACARLDRQMTSSWIMRIDHY